MLDCPTMNQKGYHIINDFNITTLPKLTIESSFSAKNDKFLDQTATQNQLVSSTSNILPTFYNFNKTVKQSFSTDKGNLNKTSEANQQIINTTKITYRLEKVCTNNETSLFPKLNI